MIQVLKNTFFLFLIGILTSNAQEFHGKATYKSKRKIDLKIDSTLLGSDIQKQIMDKLNKTFEKTHVLSFNRHTSIYKEEEALEEGATPNMSVMVIGMGKSEILYKNTKDKRFVKKTEITGKLFLVEDELESSDWKLSKETKNIGQYTCYKATRTKLVKSTVSTNNTNNTNDFENKTATITAWYTPEIPVNHGPNNYWGLPGLILEVNDGEQAIVCSKIVLNAKTKSEIKAPKKGKKVTQKQYESIMEKKMKEIQSHYRSNDAESIQIQIEN